nr:GrpB family protein [Roseobacter sp. CCS2]
MVVCVVPHNSRWASDFVMEAKAISASLGKNQIAIHHIGSTAIAGILAKPIIDLLGVVSDLDLFDARSNMIHALGYEAMGSYGIEGRRYFRKSDPTGRRTHHLHIFAEGSTHIERHLAFRDYLRCHEEVATAYSALKAALTDVQSPHQNSYIDGKGPFISAVEKDALNWYRHKRLK